MKGDELVYVWWDKNDVLCWGYSLNDFRIAKDEGKTWQNAEVYPMEWHEYLEWKNRRRPNVQKFFSF